MAAAISINVRMLRSKFNLTDMWPYIQKEFIESINAEVKPMVIGYLERVVLGYGGGGGWEHAPQFDFVTTATPTRVETIVVAKGPNAKIFKWVNWGTGPRDIKPKSGKALSFDWAGPGSWVPKTSPGGSGRYQSESGIFPFVGRRTEPYRLRGTGQRERISLKAVRTRGEHYAYDEKELTTLLGQVGLKYGDPEAGKHVTKIVKDHRIRPRLFQYAAARYSRKRFQRIMKNALQRGKGKAIRAGALGNPIS